VNGQTSVMLDGNIKVDISKVVDITLNMSNHEKIQVFSVKSDMVVIQNNLELNSNTDDSTKLEPFCMPMVGTELCGQIGHNEMSIYLSRTDEHDSYKLRYLEEANSVSFLVDMPNSRFDRKISLTLVKHGDEFKIDIHTPWKSVTSTALVALQGNEPKIDLEITIDNVMNYQGGVELRNYRTSSMHTYAPSIFIIQSGRKIIDIRGQIENYLNQRKFEVNFESSGLLPAKLRILDDRSDSRRSLSVFDLSINTVFLDMHTKMENILNQNQLQTELGLEYNFMKQNENKMKLNINFNEVSKTNYKGSLDLEMNNLPFHKIHIDTDVMCGDEDFKINTNIAAGDIFIMNAESFYKFIRNDNLLDFELQFSSKSPTHPLVDVEHSEHWKRENNKYLLDVNSEAMGMELDQHVELEYASDSGFVKVERSMKGGSYALDTQIEASYSMVEEASNRQLNTKISYDDDHKMGDQLYKNTFNWEGSLVDRSTFGKHIDNEVSIKWNMNDIYHDARLTTKANAESFTIDGISTFNGNEKFVRSNGELGALNISTNLPGKVYNLQAKYNLETPYLIEVSGDLGEKHFESRISSDQKFIEAEFRFDTMMKKMRVEIMEKGYMITMKLSPDQTVQGEIYYNFGNYNDIRVTVMTPFGEYTKQELVMNLNRISPLEFQSLIGLTWKNKNMITINASGKLESQANTNKAMLSVSSINDPSVFGFKQGSFSVKHNRNNYDLDDYIEGYINDVQVIEGSVKTQVQNLHSTVDVRLRTSEPMYITLSVENDLMKSGNLKFKYNDAFEVESSYNLSSDDVSKTLYFDLNVPGLTSIHSKLVHEMYGNTRDMYKIESEINEKKYIATVETTSDSKNALYGVSATITLPSMNPIKASMQLSKNGEHYETNFEISRFWANHGTIKYHGSFNIRSKLSANIIMTFTSPNMNTTFDISYEIGHESLDAHMKVNCDGSTHKIVIGGQWIPELYRFETKINSSFLNDELTLETKLDDKSFNITMQKGFSGNRIYLAGELIGDSASLKWQTPFSGFERFETSGSLDRNKRSAEFSIMNDASSAGIRASFNSLVIKVTTPYQSARESSFSLERKSNNEVQLHYKRNDTVIDFSATPQGRRRFNITLKSAVPGWEFLALTGRLDQEELLGYLSGQINEAKMTVNGGGYYSKRNTNLNFEITTPYVGYENISAKLMFNIRQNKFTLDINSPSSHFHVLVKSENGLTIDVHVPHQEAPTIIDSKLALGTGHFIFSSRFSLIPSINMNYTLNRTNQTFNMHLRRAGHHSEILFERITQKSASYIFRRDGKEFKIQLENSGRFPIRGTITFEINNSFRTVPRTISGSLTYDRTRNDKTFDFKLTLPNNRTVSVVGKYNISLAGLKKGDYETRITISGRPTKLISGSWDMRNNNNISMKFKVDNLEYELTGKLTLLDTKLSLNSTHRRFETIHIEWKFSPNEFYINAGTQRRFVMGKFNLDQQRRHVGVIVRASRFMRYPLEIDFNWNHDSNNGLSANGTFEFGQKQGSFDLSKLKRTASTRSFEMRFEANTNHRAMNKITINCDYSFNNEAVFNLDVDIGYSKFGIHFDIKDVTSNFTQQSATLTLPNYGEIVINFGHDFRQRTKKYTISANIQGRLSHLKAEWSRDPQYSKFNGKVDIQSRILGSILANVSYDFRDFNNAKAEINYTRGSKFFNFDFNRQLNDTELISKINFTSSHPLARTAKMEVNAKFTNGFDLTVLLQRMTRKVELSLNLNRNGLTGRLTTPYRGFELISGSLIYNITNRNNKTARLSYERGNRKINIDMELNLNGRADRGSLKITAATPFEIMKTLNLNANWANGRGTVEYNRNNISYRFEGSADVKADRTSFDLSFTPNSSQPIHIKFKFDIGSLLSGSGNYSQDIANIELEMLGKRIALDLRGYRNTEKIVLDFEGESSFEQLRKIELKVDSDLNVRNRRGSLEIKVDDFYFKMNNSFEMKPNNGYYWRSEFDSSLTNLPGLTIGFGRDEQESRILTIGSGDEREITISFKPKQRLTRGFSGTISLPHRGIHDASFDVNYKFTNQNQLELDVNIELEPGKMINFDVMYNSDGVQARLTSPMGSHRARARRSITDNSFYGEFGLDDYSVSLRGDNLSADSKKGFKLEGEILGQKISVDCILQTVANNYAEGKFIINSNISGFETVGVVFKISNENNTISAETKINLPSETMPQIIVKLTIEKTDSRRARVQLVLGDKEYSFDGNYNLLNGFGAEILVETPHEMLKKVSMKGKLLTTSVNKVDANLEIIYPSGVLNVATKYDISPASVSANLNIECMCDNRPTCTVNALFEKSHMNITAKTSIQSELLSDPISFEFLFTGEKVETSAKLFGETHILNLDTHNNGLGHKSIRIICSSPIIDGRLTVDGQLIYNRTPSLQLNITKSGGNPFKFVSNIDASDEGITVSIVRDSTASDNVSFNMKTTEKSIDIIIKKSGQELKVNLYWNLSIDNANNKIFSVDSLVTSSFFSDIKSSMKVEITERKALVETSVAYGRVSHQLKAGYTYTQSSAAFVLQLETPIFGINKMSLESDVNINRNIKATASIVLLGASHTFDLHFDHLNRKIVCEITSDEIPGKNFIIDGSVTGSSGNLNIIGRIKFNEQIFATKFTLDSSALSIINSSLEVKTPLNGYRKMNFDLKLHYLEDSFKALIRSHDLLPFTFELEAGHYNESYKAMVNINTQFDGFEKIKVTAEVPLDKTLTKVIIQLPNIEYGFEFEFRDKQFSKKAALVLIYNGRHYGGGLNLRYKAPYELDIFTNDYRFHVMMDSTMYNGLYRIIF